jgi:hypothetical protein
MPAQTRVGPRADGAGRPTPALFVSSGAPAATRVPRDAPGLRASPTVGGVQYGRSDVGTLFGRRVSGRGYARAALDGPSGPTRPRLILGPQLLSDHTCPCIKGTEAPERIDLPRPVRCAKLRLTWRRGGSEHEVGQFADSHMVRMAHVALMSSVGISVPAAESHASRTDGQPMRRCSPDSPRQFVEVGSQFRRARKGRSREVRP